MKLGLKTSMAVPVGDVEEAGRVDGDAVEDRRREFPRTARCRSSDRGRRRSGTNSSIDFPLVTSRSPVVGSTARSPGVNSARALRSPVISRRNSPLDSNSSTRVGVGDVEFAVWTDGDGVRGDEVTGRGTGERVGVDVRWGAGFFVAGEGNRFSAFT